LTFALPLIGVLLIGVGAAVDAIVARSDMNEQVIAVAHGMRWPLIVTGLVLLGAALWIGQAWRGKDARAILGRLGAAQIPLYIVLLALLLPPMNPTKSYRPQGAWIREQIGEETHIGLVYPMFARRKMGAFGYYSGALVDRMNTAQEVEEFFRRHPSSLVLVHEGSVKEIFAGDEAAWNDRVLRELRTGSHLYVVVRGP
jgi:hypothetical protein